MGFWVYMLLTDLLLPLIMIGFGCAFVKSPPKDINEVFGYRTRMSMRNKDTWEFAHHYCGKLWYRIGLVLLLVSVIVMAMVFGREEAVVSQTGGALLLAQTIPLTGTIISTERALKKNFDADGNRRRP